MPPDSPSSTDGAGRDLRGLLEGQMDDFNEAMDRAEKAEGELQAARERTRVLEEAAKFACFKLQSALDDSTAYPWQEVEDARTRLAASLDPEERA